VTTAWLSSAKQARSQTLVFELGLCSTHIQILVLLYLECSCQLRQPIRHFAFESALHATSYLMAPPRTSSVLHSPECQALASVMRNDKITSLDRQHHPVSRYLCRFAWQVSSCCIWKTRNYMTSGDSLVRAASFSSRYHYL
jgi:hypothetical protein